jgi:hypothetical protein
MIYINEITVSVCNQNTNLKKLITELADVLQKVRHGFDFVDRSTWYAYGVDELIQRARDGAKS